VLFEGDNVLINGKSNLLKQPKQQKVRIDIYFQYPLSVWVFIWNLLSKYITFLVHFFLEEGIQYIQEVNKCDDMLQLEQFLLTSFDSSQAFLRSLFS